MRNSILFTAFLFLVSLLFASMPGIELSVPSYGEINNKLHFKCLLTNNTDAVMKCKIEYSLQRDSNMVDIVAPGMVYGSNHAKGCLNWIEYDGNKIDDLSLTDGLEWTCVDLPWQKNGYKTIDQFIDLGKSRTINKIEYLAGDAKWVWQVDILASADGKTYNPVNELSQYNMNEKFGLQVIPVLKPFDARFIKLHYYHPDNVIANKFCLPTEIGIYDGMTDDYMKIPVINEIFDSNTQETTLLANESKEIKYDSNKTINVGGYFLAVKISNDNESVLKFSKYFVIPEMIKTINADSKFGINGATLEQIPLIRKLGVGWVRFENMKTPMISPKADLYKYDGKVGPWYVNHDIIMKGYSDAGLQILPYLFQSPSYNTIATKSQKHAYEYPPANFDLWSEFCYQTAARYGKTKHPDDDLKTPDKLSGLGIINSYEIWNEPNLDNPVWGAWVGTMQQYFELLRKSSGKIKLADKSAKISNGGLAGIDLHDVDMLRSYTYDDGTHPIDYLDIINVHYYSGRSSPDIATVNSNVQRDSDAKGIQTYEESLHMLNDWRVVNNINKQIWLTETGYDTGGPRGVNEQLQAAWLPRDILIALSAGIDKVFVYREKGSSPSLYAASGLVRDDNSLKPAWFTYATLIRQIGSAEKGIRLPFPDDNIRLYAWRKNDKLLLTAWTVSGISDLRLKFGDCKYTDSFGAEFAVKNNELIHLGIFPIYISDITDTKNVDELILNAKNIDKLRIESTRKKMTRKVVLFDFGGTEHIGSVTYGSVRNAIPVGCKDIWDEEKGYGFRKAAMRDGDKAWINDSLERDFTVMSAGLPFKFVLSPGKYKLTISATSFGESSLMTIKGIDGNIITRQISKDNSKIELDIVPNDAYITVDFDQYTELHWLMAIEKAD